MLHDAEHAAGLERPEHGGEGLVLGARSHPAMHVAEGDDEVCGAWRRDVAVLGQLRPFHFAVKLGRVLHCSVEGFERSLNRLVRWIARVLGGIQRAAALEIWREDFRVPAPARVAARPTVMSGLMPKKVSVSYGFSILVARLVLRRDLWSPAIMLFDVCASSPCVHGVARSGGLASISRRVAEAA